MLLDLRSHNQMMSDLPIKWAGRGVIYCQIPIDPPSGEAGYRYVTYNVGTTYLMLYETDTYNCCPPVSASAVCCIQYRLPSVVRRDNVTAQQSGE